MFKAGMYNLDLTRVKPWGAASLVHMSSEINYY